MRHLIIYALQHTSVVWNGRAWNRRGIDGRYIPNFSQKAEERDHFVDLSTDG
jgi:hypothetical protein